MTDKEIKNAIVRDVVGYEGLYTVDIFGNITKVCNRKVMSQHKSNSGYMRVILSKNKKRTNYSVHRLVAEAFIPNPLNKNQVNHIDGDKTNNVVWNLEWTTSKDNNIHAVKIGHNTKAIRVRIIETGVVYPSIRDCAKAINGHETNILQCLRGNYKYHKGFHFERVDDDAEEGIK